MKKILLIAAIAIGLAGNYTSHAQVRVNLSFGTPVIHEPWYTDDDDYYYLPERGVYYNVRRRVYVYPEQGSWYYANRLPDRYGRYSYRTSRYVRVRDRAPFDRDDNYRSRYGNYYGRHDNGWHRGWEHGRGHDHDRR